MMTSDQDRAKRGDNHAWLFAWMNGSIFQAGPSKNMNWYGTSDQGMVVTAGSRSDDGDSMNGNAVMYDAVAGKILTLGGAPNYENSAATSNAHVITISSPFTNASVQKIRNMAFARSYATSVVLPNGQVLITGGQTYARTFNDENAVLTPELWDPNSCSFTQLSNNTIPRTYHSWAILLPDATILSGGGGLCGNACLKTNGANHYDAEIFYPPYLYAPDGTLSQRPVVISLQAVAQLGDTISIEIDTPDCDLALIRFSSATHTVNTDQRRVPLSYQSDGVTYNITIPDDAGIVVPGYWMLFALNAAGVPSLSKTLQIVP